MISGRVPTMVITLRRDDIANLLPVDTLGVRLTLVELLPYPEAGKEPGKRRAVLKVLPTK